MKTVPNYRILQKITHQGGKELEAVEYGRLVGAWEWGGTYAEIARRFGVTESRVRDTINRYKETGSPLAAERSGRPPKKTTAQKNREKRAIGRTPVS